MIHEAVLSSRSAAISPLAASWCRSALHHQLDPASASRRDRLDGRSLSDRRDAHGALLAVTRPVLDQLFQAVGRSGCGVFLSDATGAIFESRAGDGDMPDFTRAGLVDGGRWSEALEGTNGIGTCLVEDRPVIIHREQHFSSRNIAISCMDAPVHDAKGRLVAALDVSSCRNDHGTAMAEMTVALVREAARRIERALFHEHFHNARILFLGDAPGGSELLAVDADDLVIGVSWAARQRLGLTEAQISGTSVTLDALTGQNAEPSFRKADRTVLRQALARAGGNVSAAARMLGIARATLYRRLMRAGLHK